MTLSTTAHLLNEAVARDRAVPSFNVISLEHAEAIVGGADLAGIGVLLQLSENAVKFHGGMRPLLAACRELATSARSPIGIHLDHFESATLIDEAIALGSGFGIGSLMVDASTEPYERNVALTASAVARGHAAGLWIEAELGEVGGKDGAHAPGVRTDPLEAARFVDATGAMTLADRVVVLRDGQIEQVGTPLELYDHPANQFVAQFIGTPKMNLMAAAQLPRLPALSSTLADRVPPQRVYRLASGMRDPASRQPKR